MFLQRMDSIERETVLRRRSLLSCSYCVKMYIKSIRGHSCHHDDDDENGDRRHRGG